MLDLTFGEQVKLVLSRKGMTIKELAEIIEKRTGKKMSRQNLTQRLGRDNFQEQDMRMIAEILECPFRLSILSDSETAEEGQTSGEAKESIQPKPVKPAAKTTKESVRIAKAKARKEKKAREAERLADAIEQVPSEMRREPVEKEMTLGDYLDIHEELVRQETARLPKVSEGAETTDAEASEENILEIGNIELSETAAKEEAQEVKGDSAEAVPEEGTDREEIDREETVQSETEEEEAAEPEEMPEPAEHPESEVPKVDVEELLREMEELEKERKLLEQQEKEEKAAREARALEEAAQEEKKVTGWRAVFQRRTKKDRQEELQEEAKIAEPAISAEEELEDDYIAYDEPEEEEQELQENREEEMTPEEVIEELMEEDDDAEDLSRGELNPYTGHEYETNSVRMHPKRIGYVQLYDRRDHGWTDMTEWAFLGYQERKKALLGKDYDPPIYLD